jgi:hypothetical protein
MPRGMEQMLQQDLRSYSDRASWMPLAPRVLIAILILSSIAWIGREHNRPPPPTQWFAGLPISGNLSDALRAGFDDCPQMDAVNIRCRRHGVMIYGNGPYEAAVDMHGSRGQSGFDHLTIWNIGDQSALYKVLFSLRDRGWTSCHTEFMLGGGQAIFMHRGSPVFVSIDLNYYGKRRLRVFPTWHSAELGGPCIGDKDLDMFASGS